MASPVSVRNFEIAALQAKNLDQAKVLSAFRAANLAIARTLLSGEGQEQTTAIDRYNQAAEILGLELTQKAV